MSKLEIPSQRNESYNVDVVESDLNSYIPPNHPSSCARCIRLCASVLLSTLGVCFTLIFYIFCGSLIFLGLEGAGTSVEEKEGGKVFPLAPILQSDTIDSRRNLTVEKLWNITEVLNVLYKENWTVMANQEIIKFQSEILQELKQEIVRSNQICKNPTDTGEKHKWTLSSAFLYSLTLITTIGYSSKVPSTLTGKLVAIVVTVLGIPILILYLAIVGGCMARLFRKLYKAVCCCCAKKKNPPPNYQTFQTECASSLPGNPSHHAKPGAKNCRDCERETLGGVKEEIVKVPVWMNIILVVLYILLGTCIFYFYHNTNFVETFFFCFTVLGTIGLGTLPLGKHQSNAESGDVDFMSVLFCSIYILLGLALLSMCFNLAHDDLKHTLASVKMCLGLRSDVYLDTS